MVAETRAMALMGAREMKMRESHLGRQRIPGFEAQGLETHVATTRNGSRIWGMGYPNPIPKINLRLRCRLCEWRRHWFLGGYKDRPRDSPDHRYGPTLPYFHNSFHKKYLHLRDIPCASRHRTIPVCTLSPCHGFRPSATGTSASNATPANTMPSARLFGPASYRQPIRPSGSAARSE